MSLELHCRHTLRPLFTAARITGIKGISALPMRYKRPTGMVAHAGGASSADTVNRWLTGALMLLFGGILAFGAGHADAGLLTATVDWRQAPPAVPIIFLALVRRRNKETLTAFSQGGCPPLSV